VVTLWYRAPELLLRSREYGEGVDTWSIGCIIAELLRQGSPLFQGNSEAHQFQMIADVIGYPLAADWEAFYAEEAREFRKSVERGSLNRKNRLGTVIPNASPSCIDLLGRMLCWDPEKRIGLKEALQHPYFHEQPKALFPD
jgi:serine/threonine protein kinase